MSEWAALAGALRERRDSGAAAALASVVSTEGSAYRHPGAWMLVGPNGAREGVVSGGCLEADVAERALACLASGKPELATYDTREEDDVVWGLGMGCRGIVRILIEPLAGDRLAKAAEFFGEAAKLSSRAWMAVALSDGPADTWRIGDRFLSSADLPPGAVSRALQGRESSPALGTVELVDGLEFAFLPVLPVPRLVVCGAGDDAMPLVRYAVELGWSVLVVDHRPGLAFAGRFPGARVEAMERPEGLAALRAERHDRTAAVVMTHNLQRDVAWTAALLPVDLAYLGLLGPKQRGTQVLAAAAALADGPTNVREIFSPAGLDIASESPREIALAIVAEISGVLGGAASGHLRDRAARKAVRTPAPR